VSGLGFAWGKNTSGQLGIDEESDLELIPRKVALQRGEQILDISCGLDHTVALVRVAQLDSTEKTTVKVWRLDKR
jgi:alpha-tubulin suppressor-like RCC1 family protein